VKIKELTEGFADDFGAGARGGFGRALGKKVASYLKKDSTKQPQDPKDKIQDPKDTIQDPKQPQDQTTTQATKISDPNKPEGNPNATLDSKIAYAKSKGWVGARPTNNDKVYLDSVDVYVDPNKLADIPASQNFIPHRQPHEKLSMGSFKAPTADINKALGMKGQSEISGYSSYILTPAGWYSKNREAYINPISRAQDVIDMYWEKSQGGRK